jgi:hypothetical protein
MISGNTVRRCDILDKGFAVTPDGRELLEVTGPTLATLDAATSRILRAEQGNARRITVGTTPWFAAHVLPPAIKAFREVRPELRIGIELWFQLGSNEGPLNRRFFGISGADSTDLRFVNNRMLYR